MAKKVPADVIEVPVSLAKLLTAEPDEFKDPKQYEDVQTLSKVILKLLADKAIIWGT